MIFTTGVSYFPIMGMIDAEGINYASGLTRPDVQQVGESGLSRHIRKVRLGSGSGLMHTLPRQSEPRRVLPSM